MLGMPRKLPLKRHHCPARGGGGAGGAIIQSHIYPKRLIACTSDFHHSTQRPEHYKILSYHFSVNFPFKKWNVHY